MQNKVAIITGGAGGIGYAVAEFFIQKCVRVVLLDWNDQVVDKSRELSTDVIGFVCNTSNQDDVETTVQKIKQQMGHIDILLNCAGVVCLDRSEDISQEDWDSTLMVNLTAFIMA